MLKKNLQFHILLLYFFLQVGPHFVAFHSLTADVSKEQRYTVLREGRRLQESKEGCKESSFKFKKMHFCLLENSTFKKIG